MSTPNRAACALLSASLILSGPLPASAQIGPLVTALPGSVPNGVSYQGRLEQNGIPVNGSRTMVFKLFDALSGGSVVWNGGNQVVSITQGLFNTVLAIPINSLTGGVPRFLEITVEGTPLTPREALQSVPYAMVAKSVEGTLEISNGGLSISSNPTAGNALKVDETSGDVELVASGGKVGIGVVNPTEKLEVNGAFKMADVKILRDVGDADRLFFQPATPNQSLNVAVAPNGATGSTGLEVFKTDGNADRVNFESLRLIANQAANRFEVRGTAGGTGSLRDLVFMQGGTELMTLATSGNVGIRTAAAPTRRLDLVDDVGGLSFEAGTGSPNSGAIRFGDNTGWKLHFGRSREVPAGALNSALAGALMTIQDNGNVGVGTTAPSQKLHVAGGWLRLDNNQRISWRNAADTVDQQTFYLNTADDLVQITAAGKDIVMAPGGTDKVRFKADGSVGIGTASPGTKLHMSSGTLTIDGDATTSFKIGTSTLVVTSNGNVGIGNSGPNVRLDVSSHAFVRGSGTIYNNPGSAELQLGYAFGAPGDAGSVSRLAIQPYGHTGGPWKFVARDDASKAYLDWVYGASATGITQDSSGNVGVGTSSPGDRLSVAGGSVGVDRSSVLGHKAGSYSYMREAQNAIGSGSGVANILSYNAVFDTGMDNRWEGIAGGRASAVVIGESANPISMHVSNVLGVGGDPITWTEALTVGSGGNVGINVQTSPGTKFHVSSGVFTLDGAGARMNIQGFKITQLFSASGQPGALPLTSGAFTTSGGTLLIIASGTGYAGVAQQIGMSIQVDATIYGQAKSYTNEVSSHKAFAANPLVVTGVPTGSHTVTLSSWNGTSTDVNDFFYVTVLELPF